MSEAHFLEFNVLIPETIPASEPTSNIELVIMNLKFSPHTIMPSSQSSPEPITPSHYTLPSVERNLNSRGDAEEKKSKEMIVYSRRPKPRYKEHLMTEAPKESEPMVAPSPPESSKSPNIDLPIALRKKTRSCTLHPISKFISYKVLSTKMHALTIKLDETKIPRNIKKALEAPRWNKAVMEEIGL